MAAPVNLNSQIIRNRLDCSSIEVGDGKMSIVFRSEESADAFDHIFRSAWKADQIMGEHCRAFIPQGYRSWKDYANMIGAPHYSMYSVTIDDEFTTSLLASKIAALYPQKADSSGSLCNQ